MGCALPGLATAWRRDAGDLSAGISSGWSARWSARPQGFSHLDYRQSPGASTSASAPGLPLPYKLAVVEYRMCSLQRNYFCTYWCVIINPFFIDKLIRKCIRFANECYISMLKWVTQFPIVPHICVSEFGLHWFRLCLVAYSAPSHCLNKCWVIVSWAIGNIVQWYFNQGGRQHPEW